MVHILNTIIKKIKIAYLTKLTFKNILKKIRKAYTLVFHKLPPFPKMVGLKYFVLLAWTGSSKSCFPLFTFNLLTIVCVKLVLLLVDKLSIIYISSVLPDPWVLEPSCCVGSLHSPPSQGLQGPLWSL